MNFDESSVASAMLLFYYKTVSQRLTNNRDYSKILM